MGRTDMGSQKPANSNRARVCVVIPVRNGEAYIEQAVRSALAQTLAPWRIVVVNDSSTDDTAKLLTSRFGNEPSVLLLDAQCGGAGAARNCGLDAAKGSDLIGFLDADDYWYPQKTEIQVAALTDDIAVVGCRLAYVGSRGKPFGRTHGALTPQQLQGAHEGSFTPGPPSSMLVRAESAMQLRFDEGEFQSAGAEDVHFLRNVLHTGGLLWLDDVLGAYRVHAQSVSALRHHQQVQVSRYFAELARSGRTESEFSLADFSAGYKLTRRQARSDKAAITFRSAGANLVDRNYVRGGALLASAALLEPRRTYRRLRDRLAPNA